MDSTDTLTKYEVRNRDRNRVLDANNRDWTVQTATAFWRRKRERKRVVDVNKRDTVAGYEMRKREID
eukprot:1354345-Amorphochlora_amoeboformis.AAC.1